MIKCVYIMELNYHNIWLKKQQQKNKKKTATLSWLTEVTVGSSYQKARQDDE